MVVIMERKNRTRILLKAISKDFLRGRTTCRWMRVDSVAGDVGLAFAFMVVRKLRCSLVGGDTIKTLVSVPGRPVMSDGAGLCGSGLPNLF